MVSCAHSVPLHRPALLGSSTPSPLDLAAHPSSKPPSAEVLKTLERGPSAYVALAIRRAPRLQAAYAEWRAHSLSVTEAGSLPDPMLRVSAFLSSIETRAGPQQGRLALEQRLPWPGTLNAKAQAKQYGANAEAFSVEALAVELRAQVERHYWRLWRLRAGVEIHREHLLVLDSLAESVRARVATGAAGLSELEQVELARIQVDDSIAAQQEKIRALESRLRGLMGFQAHFEVPTLEGPSTMNPRRVSSKILIKAARMHPKLSRLAALKEQAHSMVSKAQMRRYPELRLGVDWILIGEHELDGQVHGGQDALALGAGLSLPFWQGAYQDSIDAAEARTRSIDYTERAMADDVVSRVLEAQAIFEDAARRVATYRDALVPRSEGAYRSVLGAYTVGRGNLAQMLLAQRDLLNFKVEYEEAKADLEIARVGIEELTVLSLASLEEGGVRDE